MTAPYSHLSQESVKAKIADNAITADRADFAVRSDREILRMVLYFGTRRGSSHGMGYL